MDKIDAELWRRVILGLWRHTVVGEGTIRHLAVARPQDREGLVALRNALPTPQRAAFDERVAGRWTELAAAGAAALEDAVAHDVRLTVVTDTNYPARLREVAGSPPVLSLRGDPSALNHPLVAVVGTRRPSQAGYTRARRTVNALCDLGFGVVSGGAAGIDHAAHELCLERAHPTVWVAGTGLDEVYPSAHRALFEAIVASGRGVVLSQFPPDSAGLPWRFARRNATIAALGEATIAIEAPARSGTLKTLAAARRAGRRCFVTVGEAYRGGNEGGHAAIRERRAELLGAVGDLAEIALPASRSTDGQTALFSRRKPATPPAVARGGQSRSTRRSADCDSGAEWPRGTEGLRSRLEQGDASLDDLAALLGDDVHGMLLELELAGLVTRRPGPRFALG